MADYIAPTFSGGIPSATALNNTFADIETALNARLDTTEPATQAMEGDLDMNSHRLLNVSDIVLNGTTTSISGLQALINDERIERESDVAALELSRIAGDLSQSNALAAEALAREAADTLLQSQIDTLASVTVITDHGNLSGLGDDDHPQYLTQARGNSAYYPRAELLAVLTGYSPTTHNHNTEYYTQAQVDTMLSGVGSGVTDHGALSGLSDDDHSQYFNLSRLSSVLAGYSPLTHNHDTDYYTQAQVDALLAGVGAEGVYVPVSSSNTSKTVYEFIAGLKIKATAIVGNESLTTLLSATGSENHWHWEAHGFLIPWRGEYSHLLREGMFVLVDSVSGVGSKLFRVKAGTTAAQRFVNPTDSAQLAYDSWSFE